jgi:hypothetical protein
MTETSHDSKQSTDSTKQTSGESIVALPLLSEAKAPISLTLTIDKSVSKIAGWVLIVLFGNAMLMGGGIVAAVWMIQAFQKAEREVRLQRLETDEMNVRLEMAGIPKHKPGDSP